MTNFRRYEPIHGYKFYSLKAFLPLDRESDKLSEERTANLFFFF
jgi:hypothetical protein